MEAAGWILPETQCLGSGMVQDPTSAGRAQRVPRALLGGHYENKREGNPSYFLQVLLEIQG